MYAFRQKELRTWMDDRTDATPTLCAPQNVGAPQNAGLNTMDDKSYSKPDLSQV